MWQMNMQLYYYWAVQYNMKYIPRYNQKYLDSEQLDLYRQHRGKSSDYDLEVIKNLYFLSFVNKENTALSEGNIVYEVCEYDKRCGYDPTRLENLYMIISKNESTYTLQNMRYSTLWNFTIQEMVKDFRVLMSSGGNNR